MSYFRKPDGGSTFFLPALVGYQKAFELVVVRWQQINGIDVFEPTEDFFVTPPAFQLAPNEARSVRILRAQVPHETDEMTYRIFVKEIPLWQNHIKGHMNLSIQLSIPLFMKAIRPLPSVLDVQMGSADDGRKQRITLNNLGRSHGKISLAQPMAKGVPLGKPLNIHGYALPGNSKSWEVDNGQFADAEELLVTMPNGYSKKLPLDK